MNADVPSTSSPEVWMAGPCPFCRRVGRRILRVPNRRYDHGPDAFTLDECRDCGLWFLNPRPDRETLERYYEGYVWSVKDRLEAGLPVRGFKRALKLAWRNFAYIGGPRTVVEKVARVERHADRVPGRVLDVGSGPGEFLAAMKARGWQAVGADHSPELAAQAKSDFGLDIRVGPMEALDFEPDTFDAVTFWSSFEHMTDPATVLSKTWRVLRPGGLGVILVPNVRSLDARLYGPEWGHLELPLHISHFTPDGLRRTVARAGFTPLRMYHQTRLLVTTLEQRVEKKLCGWLGDSLPAHTAAKVGGRFVAVSVNAVAVAVRAGHNITLCFKKAEAADRQTSLGVR